MSVGKLMDDMAASQRQWCALVAELAEALKPFAQEDFQQAFSHEMSDDSPVYGRNKAVVRLGDFRRARAAYLKATL